MELRITTKQILGVLHILSWILFIGLCVEAGGIAVNTFITLFINPQQAQNFWEGADYLSALAAFDLGYFMVIALLMTIVAVFKAIMFYLIIKLFADKNTGISNPFSVSLRRFMLNQSYLALGIGLFSHAVFKYSVWLSTQGLQAADLQELHIAGADVWLFMAVVLFMIVQLVNRGIELQNENDLTI